jgi:hypothetical protein
MIDIVKIKQRRTLLGLGSFAEVRTRMCRMGYHSETTQVTLGDIKRLRKELGLTINEGVDSKTFYDGTDDMTSLLAEYQENIRRLADR